MQSSRIDHDGVKLYVEETGGGSPPIVFVHPVAGDHTFFEPQVEEFSRTNRVVTLDVRGYGASDKPEGPYAPEVLAGDLAFVCGELGIDRPLVVGCSMGGRITVEFAARYPELPCGIVVLNGSVIKNPELNGAILALAKMIRNGEADKAIEMMVDAQVGDHDPPWLREKYRRSATATAPNAIAACQEAFAAWDGEACLGAITVPALFTFSHMTRRHTELDRIQELCPQAVIGQTVGAGHFDHLAVPEQVNPMIKRFVDFYVTRALPVSTFDIRSHLQEIESHRLREG
jgi:pimeloyl-ACP methyl ester carboxylesterase